MVSYLMLRSIGLQDHLHAPRIHFHNIGLWGKDFINRYNWTLQTLSTIRRRLGHEKVNELLHYHVNAQTRPRNTQLSEFYTDSY